MRQSRYALRAMAKEGVRPSARARRAHARDFGIRGDRPRGRGAGEGIGNAGGRLVARPHDAPAEAAGVGFAQSPLELAAASDAVSVHLPLTVETKHIVTAKFFDALRPGAIFINTSRGPLVDTAALRAAIKSKSLRVGLDVFENEPAGGEADWTDAELATLATCTPHVGASTDQAAEAVAAEVVRIIALQSSAVRVVRVVGSG